MQPRKPEVLMPVKAVLFDLDGTLLDTLADLANAMNQALCNLGYPVHAQECYKTAVGDGVHLLAERVLPKEHQTPETVARLVREMQQIYSRNWMNQTRPYAGIQDLLTELSRREISAAVLSNKPDDKTQICVDHYFTKNQFAFVMGATQAFPLKPAPDAAMHIMQELSIPASQWVYLGDTNTDMLTARNAGIKAVGVTWGFRDARELREAGAELIIDHPMALLDHM
jgi:phosphoglycolate phosphatase